MLDVVIMRSVQTYEFIKMNGWSSLFKETIYHDRKAIIFEKNLLESKDQSSSLEQFGASVVEIDWDSIEKVKYYYRFKNRYFKARHYLAKGYTGFGMVAGHEVIGDIWYCTGSQGSDHPDTAWLKIDLSKDQVYTFDMFFIPERRGNNISATFQSQALFLLNKKGYEKAFAYVWADNTPALWNARFVNQWKQIRTEKMNRFLFGRMNERP